MYCENCGNILNDNDRFCEKCGTGVATIPIYTYPLSAEPPRLDFPNIKFSERNLVCIILADICVFLFVLSNLKYFFTNSYTHIHYILDIWGFIFLIPSAVRLVLVCVYASRRYSAKRKKKLLAACFLITGLSYALEVILFVHDLYRCISMYSYSVPTETIVLYSVFAIMAILNIITAILFFKGKCSTVLFYLSLGLEFVVSTGLFIERLPHYIDNYYFLGTYYSDWEGFILYLAGRLLNLIGPVLLVVIFNHNRKHDIYEAYKPQF